MTAKTFTDSSGAAWEVFEVHRASQSTGAVSAGLENGWLAFVSGETKRRLAPYPAEWGRATADELERLCASARHAPPSKFPLRRTLKPRLRRDTGSHTVIAPADQPVAEGEGAERRSVVETTVRTFAHEARTRGLPAVAAMLELKALLLDVHPEPDSPARDRPRVRRWFVDAYYFERDA